MKNSRISEIYNQIGLDEIQKERIFLRIKEKAYEESNKKRKFWNYKNITSVVAVCACAIIISINPMVQAKAKEYMKNIANWITGNSKDDYLEEANIVVENSNMSLNIISAQRVGKEIRVKYEITFPTNIETLINLDDYNTLKDYDDGENRYSYYEEILFSDIFADCKIYVNDICINDVYEDAWKYNYEFWFCKVKDIEVKENKSTQELILEINDEYVNEDFNFRFEFNKFKLDNQILEPNLKAEYTLKGGSYTGNIETKEISHEVKIDKYKYNFYGYSYTKTGIKIYANCEIIDDNDPIIFLKVTDNYGTKYLFYPRYVGDNNETAVFEIYDGPEDIYSQYSDYLNENIKSLNIEVMVKTEGFDENGNSVSENVSEFNINFEEDNEVKEMAK